MLPAELHEELRQIHSNIYLRFKYVPDTLRWGSPAHFESYDDIPKQGIIYGDCDAFAVACRKECEKRGIKARFVAASTNGSGIVNHLVLEAEGWILDNAHRSVVSRDELTYHWLAISGYQPGDPWYVIENP